MGCTSGSARTGPDKDDPGYFLWLLRLRGRPKCKEYNARDQADYQPSTNGYFHLITRSALASTFGGIVRPICLAVLRLITNSNFVGCSTGSSAGFAPLRILST